MITQVFLVLSSDVGAQAFVFSALSALVFLLSLVNKAGGDVQDR